MMWTRLGLSRDPFDRCPELDDACLPNTMASTLSELMSDLRTSHGVSLVTAEAGSGKSIMVAAFVRRLSVTADVAVLEPASLPALVRSALAQLDASVACSGGDQEWISALQARIAASAAEGRSTAIVIDDAHRLSPQTLEDLALLFGDGRSTRLHLFLFGRPRLVGRLNAASGHALDEHLLQAIELDPLSVRESVRYLERRIAICGGELLRLYDEAAVDEVVQRSGGCIARLEEIAVEAMRRAIGRGSSRALVRDVVATARRAEEEEEDAMASHQQPLRFELEDDSPESGDWHVGDEDEGADEEWEDEDSDGGDEWHAEEDEEEEDLTWEASDGHEDADEEIDEDELEEDADEEFEVDADDDEDDRVPRSGAGAAPARRRLVGPAVVSLTAALALVWAANQIPGPSDDSPRSRDAVLFAEPLDSNPAQILRLAATAEEADADAQVQAWHAQPQTRGLPTAPPTEVAHATPPPADRAASAPSGPAAKAASDAPPAVKTASASPPAAAAPAKRPAAASTTTKVASARPAAKVPAKAAPTPAASREAVYTVQLGAFRARRNAEDLARKLRDKPTHILEEGGLYRVVNGSFRSRRDATTHEAKLREAGYTTFIRTAVF